MNNQLLEIDALKQERQETFEEDKKELEEKLQLKYNKKQQLEQQLVDMTLMLKDLKAARTTINNTMSEQDKQLASLKADKARIVKIRQAVRTELDQKKVLLDQKRKENENIMDRLASN